MGLLPSSPSQQPPRQPPMEGPQPASSAEAPTAVDDDKSVNVSKRSSRVAVKSRDGKADQANGSDSDWQQCCSEFGEGTKRSNTRGHPQGLKRKRSSNGKDSLENCYTTHSKKATYCVVAAGRWPLWAEEQQLILQELSSEKSSRIPQRTTKGSNRLQHGNIAMAEVTAAAAPREVLPRMALCC